MAQMAPRWLPGISELPDGSQMAQGSSLMAPKWLRWLPSASKGLPDGQQDVSLNGSRQLSDGSQVAQVAPKWLQGAPRCLPDASSGSQVSPGCSQVVPRSSGGSAQRPPPSLQTSPIDAATCSAKPSSADRLPAKQCEGVPLPPPIALLLLSGGLCLAAAQMCSLRRPAEQREANAIKPLSRR